MLFCITNTNLALNVIEIKYTAQADLSSNPIVDLTDVLKKILMLS
jgi:hypothetical protein